MRPGGCCTLILRRALACTSQGNLLGGVSIPLTAEEVVTIGQRFRNEARFSERKRYIENWRAYRWGRMPVRVEGIGELLEHQSPVAEAHIKRYRNRMRSADIRILVSAKHERDVEAAQLVEDFFYAEFYDLARKRTGKLRAADDRALDYQVADGCGVRQLAWSPDVLDKLFTGIPNVMDEELPAALKKALGKDGFQGNPFELRAPDWIATYFDDDTRTVCEYGEVRLSVLKEIYGEDEVADFMDVTTDTRSEDFRAQERMVEYYHLETGEYVYDCLYGDTYERGQPVSKKGKLARCYPNAAGRPRYTFAAGDETSGDELWQQFNPPVHEIYRLMGEVNLYGTLLNSVSLMSGRAPYQEVRVGGQGAPDTPNILDRPSEERRVIWMDPREPIWPEPRPGFRWEPVPIPDMNVVEIRYQQRMQEIREYGFPSVLSPSGPSPDQAASSGYHAAVEQQGAADFLEPPLQNLASAWHETFMLMVDSLVKVDIPVSMFFHRRSMGETSKMAKLWTIKPQHFDAVGNLEVRFESISQTTKFAQDEANRRDVQQRLKPRSYYFQGTNDNWVEAMKQVDLDDAADGAAQLAVQTALQLLQANAQLYTDDVLAAAGLPTTSQRVARPEGGAVPGLGAPVTPPGQTQPGEAGPINPAEIVGGAVG